MQNNQQITLRLLRPETDFPRLAELMSMVEREPVTVEDLEEWQRRLSVDRIQQQMVALDGQGRLVGLSKVWRNPWKAAGKFGMDIIVDPVVRQQGIGSRLYTDALAFAQQHGATLFEAEIPDNVPETLHFAQTRGFAIDRHLFGSKLDLASFDETRFAGVIERVEVSGLRLTSLAELGETAENQHRLYELNRRVVLDIPGHEQAYRPFEQFQRDVFESSWYRADGQFVALDGERWIGMSSVGYFESSNSMYNMITGVDRDYRGRGIALALKLLVVRYARRSGAVYISTNNDSENAPMLAVNRKLGYVAEPGKYLLIKRYREAQGRLTLDPTLPF